MSKKRGPWGDDNDQQRQRMGVVPTRFLSWTFEIKVAECWVSDGFNPDADDVHAMLQNRLGYADGHEIQVRLVKDAPQKIVAQCQGYRSVKEMKKSHKRVTVCRS